MQFVYEPIHLSIMRLNPFSTLLQYVGIVLWTVLCQFEGNAAFLDTN